MRRKINRYIIRSKWFVYFLYRCIRMYSWTFNLTVENEQDWLDYLTGGGTVLICTWHQQFFSAIRHFQRYKIYKPSIMISQSSDGEIIAGVANHTGWHTIRGSSSKDGKIALVNMIAKLKETRLAAHIVDGPRGPAGKVKAGVIRLAHAANAVIVPFYVTAENAWQFNSWDRFLLPKPFSKVRLHFGKMIKFNNQESFEAQRRQLEEIMLPALIN